jgi:hypothetical protein
MSSMSARRGAAGHRRERVLETRGGTHLAPCGDSKAGPVTIRSVPDSDQSPNLLQECG